MIDSKPDVQEKELEILNQIYSSDAEVHQRDLANIVGLSLGMTNAILKRLAQKGFLTIRKVNNRNIRYIVSSKGIEAITRRSYRYFKRTIKNVVYYRNAIERFTREVKRRGYERLMLIGASDLDFIVEHACAQSGLVYVKTDDEDESGLFLLYSESYIPEEVDDRPSGESTSFLQDILIWKQE